MPANDDIGGRLAYLLHELHHSGIAAAIETLFVGMKRIDQPM